MLLQASSSSQLCCSSLFSFHHHCLFLFPFRTPLRFPFSLKPIKLIISPVNATPAAMGPTRSQLEENEDDVEESEGGSPQLADVAEDEDLRRFTSPAVEVKELEELPEQWRRSRIAWLCKELPPHKPATLLRILGAQRKWIRQEDATYIVMHCMRIRENEASYRVYRWMTQQHWYHFDFALVTKLADYLGKDRKFAKCRELFDDIINQGRVPSESTFHILIVAYLSAPVDGCLEEACSIYNRMIQSGGYRPRLSLHNSLFRALVSKTGGASKPHLKQAEFIYHNIVTSDLEVHMDVYTGLIWLHSYQDVVDRERISALREEMRNAGFEASRDVLVSIMRASSKVGDLEETERIWLKLLESGGSLPSQAFVFRMELYAKLGDPMKSLEIFKSMKNQMLTTVAAYHKIIEVISKAHEVDFAEKLLDEFVESGMKPLMPAFIDLIYMYFNLEMDDKLELAVSKCLTRCHPNRTFYNIYLQSLVRTGNLEKAEEIFNKMYSNGTIGATARSCNTILGGYLDSNEYEKAEKVYHIMRQKKYDVDQQFRENLQHMFSLKRKVVKRRVSMKLDQEQREILIGLLLGGVQIESDEERRNHAIHFEFSESSEIHCSLKMHIHERFYEWLTSSSRSADEEREVPCRFSTTTHSYFGFFAEQFWMKGRLMIPKLIHRWLSPRVLAYWYMLGGFRISSGDILLKLKTGNREDIERVVEALRAKSMACKVKRKGRVSWIGLQRSNATSFWEMVEPYVLENIRDHLAPWRGESQDGKNRDFDTETESDEQGFFNQDGEVFSSSSIITGEDAQN